MVKYTISLLFFVTVSLLLLFSFLFQPSRAHSQTSNDVTLHQSTSYPHTHTYPHSRVSFIVEAAIQAINTAIDGGSMTSLLRALQSEDSHLNEVDPQNVRWYQDILDKTKKDHGEVR